MSSVLLLSVLVFSGLPWSVISSGLSWYGIIWVDFMYAMVLYFMLSAGPYSSFLVCSSVSLFVYSELLPLILMFSLVYYRPLSSGFSELKKINLFVSANLCSNG